MQSVLRQHGIVCPVVTQRDRELRSRTFSYLLYTYSSISNSARGQKHEKSSVSQPAPMSLQAPVHSAMLKRDTNQRYISTNLRQTQQRL